MRKFWVFWTFSANYASSFTPVEAKNVVEAIQQGTMYDPYKADEQGKQMRFLVFEEGGTLVWDGPAPKLEDSPGNVIMGSDVPATGKLLGKGSEHENDLEWLYETKISLDTEHRLADHLVPFGLRVKSAIIVGNEDAPDAIYLSTQEEPTVDHELYRFS